MELDEFQSCMHDLLLGDKPKDEVVIDVIEDLHPAGDDFAGAIALLTREPFDNIGVGKQSVRNIATECFDVSYERVRELERDYGDLPSAIGHADMDTERLTPKEKITLGELYQQVEMIRDKSGPEKDRAITKLLGYAEPKWVAHALLGKKGVSLGIGEKSVVKAIAAEYGPSDYRRALALNPDVIALCRAMCTDGEDVQMAPVVGDPFLPMLAKSKDVPDDPDGEWIVQPKYDGARILVHIKDGELVEAFSRNANRVGDSLPELSDLVDDVFEADGEYILDGEAVPFKDGEQQPFQAVMTRFGREDDIDEQEIDIQFKFFDLVHADNGMRAYDGDLSSETAETRSYLLWWLFGGEQQYVTPSFVPDDEEEMVEQYRGFVDDGYEGAVVKQKDSEYEFNKRSSNWRKMIPEKENIDLRVTAVEEGENSNSGTVGAIFVETEDGHSLGKVGEGMKGKERTPWEDRQTVIDKIAEVSWRELSEDSDGSPALRFPNMEGYREDKSEADSLDRVKSL